MNSNQQTIVPEKKDKKDFEIQTIIQIPLQPELEYPGSDFEQPEISEQNTSKRVIVIEIT